MTRWYDGPSLDARRLAFGVAHTTLENSILGRRKHPVRVWRYLLVAFFVVCGTVLAINVARYIEWGLS